MTGRKQIKQIPLKRPPRLNVKKQLAVTMVASGLRNYEIASRLKVSDQQVSNWRQDPAFRAAVRDILRETEEAVRSRLRGMTMKALDVLEETMDKGKRKPTSRDRLLAAVRILQTFGHDNPADGHIHNPDESFL